MAIDNPIGTVTKVVASVGALNWGLIEAIDVNLLTDVLPLSAADGTLGPVYLAIGAAGALGLYYEAKWQGLLDGGD